VTAPLSALVLDGPIVWRIKTGDGFTMKKPAQRWSWIGAAALLIALLAGFTPFTQLTIAQTPAGAAGEEFSGTLSDRACPNIGPAGEREGDTYVCGIVTVPEDYGNPDGRQIRISYAVLKSFSRSPLPDPMVYLAGGPGGSSLQGISGHAEFWEDVRAYRDVVLFDQRGTKYSNRLNCDPYRFSFNYLLETDEEFQELLAEIEELTDAESLPSAVLQIIYQACADGLIDAGNDLAQYNSANSVRDIFALTNALGYDEVNLVGVSYGTRLALTAMRDHPQQIRSVVIDSVYPVHVNSLEWYPRQADEPINRIVETCENDRQCDREFPDFRENVIALSEHLEANDPDALYGLLALFDATNSFPEIAEYLPLMLDELTSGPVTPVYDAVVAGDLPAQAETENQPGEGDDLLLQAQDLEETAESLFLIAAMQEQANRPGAVWMSTVGEVMAPLSREENGLVALTLLSIPIYFPEPSIDVLRNFVADYLPRDAQLDLLAALNTLDASEVQFIYDRINDLSDELSGETSGYTPGMFYAVECQEEVPFNDLTVAQESIDDLNFPALSGLAIEISEEVAAVCEIWPTENPDPIENEPIASDIPTLILVGDWDIQTPASWGKLLLQHLGNATLVEAPSAGHGVMFDSDCSFDIFLSFLATPVAAPVLDCLQSLEPDFVTRSEGRAQLIEVYGTADDATETSGELDEGDASGGGGEDRPTAGRTVEQSVHPSGRGSSLRQAGTSIRAMDSANRRHPDGVARYLGDFTSSRRGG
jgi:pimeloyl-ACP methyl ester carboxylesterase